MTLVVRAMRHRLRARLLTAVALAAAVLLSGCGGGLAPGSGPQADPLSRLASSGGPPPPPGGYFTLKPVGSYASLPSDATAAAEVHRSAWEVRPGREHSMSIR